MKNQLQVLICFALIFIVACGSPATATQSTRPTLGVHVVSSDFERPQPMQEIVDLGTGWVRVNIGSRLARRKDSMDKWAKRLKTLHAGDVGIFATIYGRNNKFANNFPESNAELDQFQTNLDTILTTLAPYVDIWQLENELTLDHHWPKGLDAASKGKIYAKNWKRFSESVRKIDPSAELTVFGLPGSGGWKKIESHYLPPLLRVDPKGFDVLDIHCHTSFQPDVSYIAPWKHVGKLASKALGKTIDLVSTEGSTWSGEPVGKPKQNEFQMATHLVRKDLALASAGVRFTCFGPLANRSQWKKSEGPHRFSLNGLYTKGSDGKRKMAADSLERLCRIWRSSYWQQLNLTKNKGLISVTCRSSDETFAGLILWSLKGNKWTVPDNMNGWTLTYLCGQPRETTVRSGQQLSLSHSPMLLTRQAVLQTAP